MPGSRAQRARYARPALHAPASSAKPLFTVFTPTFNRRETVGRVFDSLRAQTSRDFEWLIVDDGSTDGTEAVVERWRATADFPIRYLRQENQGKHVAMNRAAAEAAGELFLPLDSDDACVPEALATFAEHWRAIPPAEREDFAGMCCHYLTEDGELLGRRFGEPWFDAYPADLVGSGRVVGDKWGFNRTEIQRRYPLPEYPGEKSVPEGLAWDRIGRSYKLRYLDVALGIYHPSRDGWMSNLRARAARSPNAHADYYAQRLDLPLRPRDRFKALANQCRYALHARRGVRSLRLGRSHRATAALMLAAALPLGFLLYVRDRRVLASGE